MKKIICTILLITLTQVLFSQYLHYWDNSRRRNAQPAEQSAPPPENKPVPVQQPEEKPAPLPIANPVTLSAATLVIATNIPFNTVSDLPKIYRPPMIFHDWPDKCPGLTGAVPVLLNYVPAEIVLMVTEKYEGHLYSISTNKSANGKPEYKLKVCKNGMIRYEYANYKGEIMADREE